MDMGTEGTQQQLISISWFAVAVKLDSNNIESIFSQKRAAHPFIKLKYQHYKLIQHLCWKEIGRVGLIYAKHLYDLQYAEQSSQQSTISFKRQTTTHDMVLSCFGNLSEDDDDDESSNDMAVISQ